ncbi:MAG: secretion protein HylD, partial [Bordetella sp.]|nr:secretion protein HylD [Bordetella sp.]
MSTAPRETLLATLLQLEQRARACTSPQDLAFLMVNDTHALAPYRQAALWRAGDGGDGTIEALSGLAVPERNAPFNVWLSALLARRLRDGAGLAAGPLQPAAEDAAMWVEHLPPHAWLLPLALGDAQRPDAALLLARDTPWDKRETTLLGLLADAYAHAWRALRPATRQRRGPAQWWSGLRHGAHRRRWWLGLALAVTALLVVP